MDKLLAGNNVAVTEDGYLEDFNQWSKEIASEIAAEYGITLGEDHWKVILYIQEQYEKGVPLSIRSIGKSGVVSIKEFYQLFPDGPLKRASKIAGIPKPVSCI
ncbi:TusE/DsrC/DsvC family sulfur relay protein [Flavilitoribacter nigricans]|uniref:Sulfur relay protein DsrC n=1 Tax=Flavilitoribacter nigricans (strain ATCC 23147 / DSM 23189 / NBRC 102662 / NCIMB 1420 / SS-2) TaxID=1122177 RepID=A0A2D0NDL1_FLAN2|nr:TusE/DsrC/DsvC family sulfur relay protein [Flavilitoribacter nigricans]PHN06601.1 sulfur relay protein DsrC [Flavilitoribacter nigricans DSM 23189 = NBRC 102662]